jgi:hypothetical protein
MWWTDSIPSRRWVVFRPAPFKIAVHPLKNNQRDEGHSISTNSFDDGNELTVTVLDRVYCSLVTIDNHGNLCSYAQLHPLLVQSLCVTLLETGCHLDLEVHMPGKEPLGP